MDHRLDLHRLTVEQATAAVERHLTRANSASLPFVHIIHGNGTGTLKEAVQSLLGRHPLVAAHRPASQADGGYGVTVAELRRATSAPLSRVEADQLSRPQPLKRK
jgi:DNA mismatch repair protein MutS2